MLKLKPGLGCDSLETSAALDMLKEQMQYFGHYILANTPAVAWRLGSLQPPQTSGGNHTNRLFVEPLQFDGKKSTAIHRPVWVVKASVLLDAQKSKAFTDIFSKGVRSYVIGTPFMGNVYTLHPCIRDLPGVNTVPEPIAEHGKNVVVLFFRDMHREAIVYNSFAAAAKKCSASVEELERVRATSSDASAAFGQREASSLRAWLGLKLKSSPEAPDGCLQQFKQRDPRAVMSIIFGDAAERRLRINTAIQALQVTPSEMQMRLIEKVVCNSIIDSFAGSGKTLTVEIMMHMCAHAAGSPLMLFSSETNMMVKEMYERFSWMPAKQRLLLATEDVGTHLEDHGDLFLQGITDEFLSRELPLCAIIDHL